MPSYQHAATSHQNPAAPTSERWLRFTTAVKVSTATRERLAARLAERRDRGRRTGHRDNAVHR